MVHVSLEQAAPAHLKQDLQNAASRMRKLQAIRLWGRSVGLFEEALKNFLEVKKFEHSYTPVIKHSNGISPFFNRKYIFKRFIFHCHVSLPEGSFYAIACMFSSATDYK